MVEYTYSAWGELLSITGSMADSIGQKNPLRYRGYYYDNETGFYYLLSRYYDPVIGRYINSDGSVAGIGGEILGYIAKDVLVYATTNVNPLPRWNANMAINLSNLIKDKNETTTTANKIVNDQNGATGDEFVYGLHSASWN